MALETATPRSRRDLLAGALGGLAAAVAGALGRPQEAAAAAGSPLIIGSQANNAGTADTQLIANSSVIAFKLLQYGGGTALMGHANRSYGGTRGVYGRTDSPDGFGVQARNAGAQGSGAAVQAIGVNNHGVDASTGNSGRYAVKALHTASGYGVYAQVLSGGIGVYGSGATGVWGVGALYGVQGSGVNVGVSGSSNTGFGVYGSTVSGYAGYFNGALYATSANAAIKNFRIDHPLDPANKVLMHSCVESNERLTVYAGTATTDENGEATVDLPGYFGALNRELRYQLTPLGDARTWVKQKVKGNRFTIATSEPGTEVCWQVSGVRQDAYAAAHPLVVESAKTGKEKGKYLNPVEHGQPESAGIDYELRSRARAGEAAQALR